MSFGEKQTDHSRGKFAYCSAGYSYGGGREAVGNVRISGRLNQEAFEGLLKEENIQRIVGFTNGKVS